MEPHSNQAIEKNKYPETGNVEKTLCDSDKKLLNLIAEIIVEIILQEEE